MTGGNFHEDDRSSDAKSSSDRSFGIVFAVVFAIVASWPAVDGAAPRWWALAIAGVFLLAALARPKALAPLNRAWTAFGRLLHNVTNPVIMGLVFYGAVTPTALIMRALGKDPLRRRRDPGAKTYWIEREPPGPEAETMDRQF